MLCVISDSYFPCIRTSEPTWKYDVSWVDVKDCQKTCRTKVKTIQIPVICRERPPLWPTFPEVGETHNLSCGRHGSWSSQMLEEKKSSKMSGLLIWTEQLESWIVVGRILVEKIWENHVMLDEHGIAMIAYAPLCIIEGFGGWYGVTEKPYFLNSCC